MLKQQVLTSAGKVEPKWSLKYGFESNPTVATGFEGKQSAFVRMCVRLGGNRSCLILILYIAVPDIKTSSWTELLVAFALRPSGQGVFV